MEKGSLAYINYTLKVKGEDKIVETTIEDVAKEAGIHNPTVKYKPVLVAAGDKWVVEGLDEALLKMKEGEKRTVEVPPEKGYGERDPSKIRLIPIRKFGEDASRLKIGDQVEINGQVGTVTYIGSGRVAVDFNHRLAGKTLVYEVEVVKVLKTLNERVRALAARMLGVDEDDLEVRVSGGSATITIPSDKPVEVSRYAKKAAANTIFRYTQVKRVVFQEVYESEEKKETETKKEPVKSKK
jgi:peptidylprolyl isomerase